MFGPGQLSNPNGPGVSEEGGHNLGRGDLGSSDDGRGPRDDLSCDVLLLEVLLGWSCSGGRDGINNRRGNRGLLTTLEQRPCASWEEGWTARGPSTGQRTIPRVKPTIRLSALSKQVAASRPQPLKSLVGLVGLGGSGGHLHRRLCPALGTRGPVGISGIFRGPGRRLARLVGQCRRRRREVVSRHKMVNRGLKMVGWAAVVHGRKDAKSAPEAPPRLVRLAPYRSRVYSVLWSRCLRPGVMGDPSTRKKLVCVCAGVPTSNQELGKGRYV